MGYEFFLSLIALILGGAWHYGSSGPAKRENFRQWLSEKTQQAKPLVARSAVRLLFICLLVGAAAITWSSAKEIYDFRTSAEPITRKEVFMLLLNTFNTLAYAGASLAFFMLSVAPFPKKRMPLILTEGEPVSFRLQGSTDAAELQRALGEGITVTVSIDASRKIKVTADNIDGISISCI